MTILKHIAEVFGAIGNIMAAIRRMTRKRDDALSFHINIDRRTLAAVAVIAFTIVIVSRTRP
jgi:hypothetical protein